MSKIIKGQVGGEALKAFAAFEGEQIFADKPIVNPQELGAAHIPVVGQLVCFEELNLPKGAKRADGKETWTAAVIHLTKPTKALDGEDKPIDVEAGRDVYVAVNPNNINTLEPLTGKSDMFEVCMLGNGQLDLKNGNRPMQLWDIKVSPRTVKRTGRFAAFGGPTVALSAATIAQLEAASNGAAVHAP